MTANNASYFRILLLLSCLFMAFGVNAQDEDKPVFGIIGTGDMGDSLGVRLAGLGYPIVYGSRDPDGAKAQVVVAQTGHGAYATNQK